MAFGSVDVRLRPIKLAFLVHPNDKEALMEAIKINTFLWGGMYNPIIPAYDRVPRRWTDTPAKSNSVVAGYIDAFYPDYVVPLGRCFNHTFYIGKRETITPSDIFAEWEKHGTPTYGISVFQVLERFISEELKFVRREPLMIIFPEVGRAYNYFFASVFGMLPGHKECIFRNRFEKILGVKRKPCPIGSYPEFLNPRNLSLINMSSLYLKTFISGRSERGTGVFYLDATNPMDIIDYWNLRAIGWRVIPVPKQAADSQSVKVFVREFVNENYYSYANNPDIFHNTSFLKGRRIAFKELQEFGKTLDLDTSSDKPGQSKYALQHWYPRIWNPWAREYDNVEFCRIEADSARHDIVDPQKEIEFRTVSPKFRLRPFATQYANEIDLRLYGGKEPLAEVIPEGEKELVRAIRGSGFDEWRFSDRGIVYLSRYTDWPVHLSSPMAEDVFLEWLEARKWKAEISTSGRIAKQMLKQLGGVSGLETLACEGIIRLLGRMGEGKPMHEKTLWGELSKISNQERFIGTPDVILQSLLKSQMLRLGIRVQCPVCSQHPWFSIKDADYELQCPECSGYFSFPSHAPQKEVKWSYRTFGPFSLPKKAYGVYSVLLTLRFFSRVLEGATTPIMSFTANRHGRKIEVDLGLLFRTSGSSKACILAECKTFDRFDKKDINRMKLLEGQLPREVLVFATLNRSLTQKEKRLIIPMVNRNRRLRESRRNYAPIMILTATELFARLSLHQAWKDAGGKHADLAKNYMGLHNLVDLSDMTQQLYLDVEPYHDWLQERYRKRLERKVKRRITGLRGRAN